MAAVKYRGAPSRRPFITPQCLLLRVTPAAPAPGTQSQLVQGSSPQSPSESPALGTVRRVSMGSPSTQTQRPRRWGGERGIDGTGDADW